MIDKLYVVTTIFSPYNYQSRYSIYNKFKEHIKNSGAILYTAELIFEGQEFTVTDANDPTCLQLKTTSPLWYKENLINLMIKKLPSDWQYVAWIDADLIFSNNDWVNLTLEGLKTSPIIQMFSKINYLNKEGLIESTANSYVYKYKNRGSSIVPITLNDDPKQKFFDKRNLFRGTQEIKQTRITGKAPPGGAFAITRTAYDYIGSILDYAILGSGDAYFIFSIIGNIEEYLFPGISEPFKNKILAEVLLILPSI